MHSVSRRRLLGAALAIVTGLTVLPQQANAATATTAVALSLPAPTGPHRVGATMLDLKDTSRADPWVPADPARELMVTMWYPTDVNRGRTIQYQTRAESQGYVAGKHIEEYLSPDSLSEVPTHAYLDAPPAGRPRSLPLIVLSPGYTAHRSSLTSLAEDLASHGYVVAAIDHTYETYAIQFSDGRIATCATCAIDNDQDTFFPKLLQVHAADVSFVLNQLTGARPAWPGSRLIDTSRIGMAGHSAGGAAALPAMLADSRIDAGVDLDGTTWFQVPGSGLSRPVLLLGTQAKHSPGKDPAWDQDFSRLTGWRRWFTVAGTVHSSFADYGVFIDQIGVDQGATTTGLRSIDITRRYTLAMFDQHLRHIPQPLLDSASPCFPEVAIEAT
ncbi:putative dienelactone hydrolase [Kibdelosporangium banguiense]|uniref:Dienelactone hydrolase n=1 Tax=Kibdelosporangium banguiense TaxID=1365924 RepID=A0ABS4TNQ5_9PSEU|nr:alpha/beta hydrolase [Kibdelosporangium banguiense]MBP2325629.1 putative dienelactone hydrolase [Kibdelosporangium banguiense]